MPALKIQYRTTPAVDTALLQQLFRAEEWNDAYDLDEVQFYLETALYVVTAWHEERLIGFGRLCGNGRLDVEISDVLVDTAYQGQGIGTEIVRRLYQEITRLDPYYIQVTPIDARSIHLYAKFGFTLMENFYRMEADTGKLRRKVAAVRTACRGETR
jgi:GNAT superfamily N-acetyltransferase